MKKAVSIAIAVLLVATVASAQEIFQQDTPSLPAAYETWEDKTTVQCGELDAEVFTYTTPLEESHVTTYTHNDEMIIVEVFTAEGTRQTFDTLFVWGKFEGLWYGVDREEDDAAADRILRSALQNNKHDLLSVYRVCQAEILQSKAANSLRETGEAIKDGFILQLDKLKKALE